LFINLVKKYDTDYLSKKVIYDQILKRLVKDLLKEDLCYKTLYMLSIFFFTALLLLVSETTSFVSNSYYTANAVSESATTPKLPLPGSQTFLNVVTQVDNTDGGTKKPSDFAITVTGNSPSPSSFSGSSSGTSVTLKDGKYRVTSSGPSGYSPSYSSGCSGTASGGVPVKCTISLSFTKVTDTITVGNNPQSIAINPATNIVYVANSNDSTVSVVNGANDKVIDTITVGNNPQSIAINPATNIVYVANSNDSTVSVVNGKIYNQ
jgi:YVTN family beta-propeller protein